MTDSPHIIVIDDDPLVLEVTAELLEFTGARVTCAQEWTDLGGSDLSATVDLILLDVMMPSLRGDDLVPILRRNLSPRTVIVLYSGMPAPELAKIAQECGVEHFLQKGSVTGHALIKAVEALLPSRPAPQLS